MKKLFMSLVVLLCATAAWAQTTVTTAKGTHTEQCQYCTTPFEPEQHTFVDNVCTVCGVTDAFGTGISHTEITETTERAGAWYDMQGRKLNAKPTQKGLYIYNGKKQVIK